MPWQWKEKKRKFENILKYRYYLSKTFYLKIERFEYMRF